ncbi:Na+/H+ antiporter NhaA [Stieleria sp. JC731]|uniref:Na+/H+ antiporter NhaA n=1 Tax=Pirellulaceae TaxID=2691357 RepID=UPI001E511B55|nr:Na+/H+ antiporter NhaA [Stieleria sp. JC731]MCC9601098.1 Na+/H+ antiporter NhaA [Stieleria sp. JC731]
MSKPTGGDQPIRAFLYNNSMFLVLGSLLALLWANADGLFSGHSYHNFVHVNLWPLASHGHDAHGLTFHFVVNDILMALFFAIAAKEVWESILPGGALSNLRTAATPLLATAGGVVGPSIVYIIGALMVGQYGELGNGWAIPCATDIAFSYLIARLIFGTGHPAISFLLLLAIADDAVGLAILAVFYPSGDVNMSWLGLTAIAVATGFGFNKAGIKNFWWYLAIPGVLSWISFYMSGIHAALGLVPIIPTLPHAKRDEGIFAEDGSQTDTLNQFEHWWKEPVELILGMFALVNAGVVLSSVGAGTWLVTLGLFVGKPLGIVAFSYFAVRVLKLDLPGGMNLKHVTVIGCIASLGFTVALFVSTAAFPNPGPIQDSVKMGALLSFLAPVTAIVAAKALGIRLAFLDRKAAA